MEQAWIWSSYYLLLCSIVVLLSVVHQVSAFGFSFFNTTYKSGPAEPKWQKGSFAPPDLTNTKGGGVMATTLQLAPFPWIFRPSAGSDNGRLSKDCMLWGVWWSHTFSFDFSSPCETFLRWSFSVFSQTPNSSPRTVQCCPGQYALCAVSDMYIFA